ncbi:MAG: alpha/beta fold hydrolase [Candidatus Nanopelagicales bacterium]
MNNPPRRGYDTNVVSIRGLSVRILVEGDGDPLLLLNGLTRPLESWGPFRQALSGRRVVTIDAPGVGGSPRPLLPLSISALANIAVTVLDELDLESVDVLGFSYGGAVAQELAAHNPARVSHLVLASTSCGIGAVPGSRDALAAFRAPSGADSWPRTDAIGALWHSLAISSWSSIPFLGAIRAPTLVVCGDHDRVVPPANSRLLARRIPGAQLVLLSAGHDLQRLGPAAALAGAVELFLTAGHVLDPLSS